jgi:hypothetical protein
MRRIAPFCLCLFTGAVLLVLPPSTEALAVPPIGLHQGIAEDGNLHLAQRGRGGGARAFRGGGARAFRGGGARAFRGGGRAFAFRGGGGRAWRRGGGRAFAFRGGGRGWRGGRRWRGPRWGWGFAAAPIFYGARCRWVRRCW